MNELLFYQYDFHGCQKCRQKSSFNKLNKYMLCEFRHQLPAQPWMKLYFSNLASYLWMEYFVWLRISSWLRSFVRWEKRLPFLSSDKGLNAIFSDCVWLITCKGKSNKLHPCIRHQYEVTCQDINHTPMSVLPWDGSHRFSHACLAFFQMMCVWRCSWEVINLQRRHLFLLCCFT